MTAATVEQQGESKRRREQPEAPQAADSSSSSESSTDTEMGLVDVCAIHCGNPERATGKPVGVAFDLTKWDFNKADCRTRCRKLIEISKPVLLIGSPIDSGEDEEQTQAVLHLAFICESYEIQVREGLCFLHTFALSQKLGAANSCGFLEQVPRHVPNSD